MGRGRTPPSDMNASVHHTFFDDKIAGVHAATAGAAELTFTAAPIGCELRLFTPVTLSDVTKSYRPISNLCIQAVGKISLPAACVLSENQQFTA